MEYNFRCKLCGHSESWNSTTAVTLAANRHLFEEHGLAELPLEHPEDHGRRFEQWEMQI